MRAPKHAVVKFETEEAKTVACVDPDRPAKIYAQWMSGFTEDEIAAFHKITPAEVTQDIMVIVESIPIRTIIAHNNDRSRIIMQREQSADFRKLMGDALKMTAKSYIDSGMSPAATLKEFREAVGMTEKPGAFLSLQQNFIQGGNGGAGNGAPASAEDVIRRVLKRIAEQSPPPTLDEPIDVETDFTETEDSIPDDDD